MRIITGSDRETRNIGKQLAAGLKGGDIICLYGELGAGKTTLVKGIAAGLGVAEEITSPSFVLMNIYNIGVQIPDGGSQKSEIRNRTSDVRNPKSEIRYLIHIDTYRLKNEKELLEIGVEDYLGQPDTATIIEWPEKIPGLLKSAAAAKKIIGVTLAHDNGEADYARTIIIS